MFCSGSLHGRFEYNENGDWTLNRVGGGGERGSGGFLGGPGVLAGMVTVSI